MATNRGKIHIVNLSNGEPYRSSQLRIADTIRQHTTREVVVHSDTMETIRDRSWYPFMEELFKEWHCQGRRDGYYCAWKPLIMLDAFEKMADGDVLYYTDSSKYCMTGFRENVDKFIDTVKERGMIPGSVGLNQPNWNNLCDRSHIWAQMGAGHLYKQALLKPHMLASWVAFEKNPKAEAFLREWAKWAMARDMNGVPLVVQLHTVDQMLLNILLWRKAHEEPDYPGYRVFHHPQIPHDMNKDYNVILHVINSYPGNIHNDLFKTPAMLPDRLTP